MEGEKVERLMGDLKKVDKGLERWRNMFCYQFVVKNRRGHCHVTLLLRLPVHKRQ